MKKENSIKKHFCILDPQKILPLNQKYLDSVPDYWSATLQAFHSNLTSIIHTANLPFSAVKANVIIAELNRRLINPALKKIPTIYEVQTDLLKDLDNDSEAQPLFQEIFTQLRQHMKIKSLFQSYKEIHAQSIVMIAGALEIFFTETFKELFNRHPKKAAQFLCHPSIKSSQLKTRVAIEDLVKMEFVLSNKMGSYIFSERRIDTISFFLKSCQIVFEEAPKDTNKKIEKIFSKRHVIVHRRGLIDEKYSKDEKDQESR